MTASEGPVNSVKISCVSARHFAVVDCIAIWKNITGVMFARANRARIKIQGNKLQCLMIMTMHGHISLEMLTYSLVRAVFHIWNIDLTRLKVS